MKVNFFALVFAVMALAACATPPLASDSSRDIAIRFEARIGEQRLECGRTYNGVGSTAAAITLQDMRVYISNVRLIGRDGHETPLPLTPDGLFQSDRVALLDFENATGNCNGTALTNSVIRGRAPPGDYVGLAFDIGVPQDLNHQDTTIAAPPLNFSGLTWPWRYGYRFTTIDLETTPRPGVAPSANLASGFSVHIGSVDCGAGSPRTPPETPCATANRPTFKLQRFDSTSQIVVLDLGALLSKTDVTVNAPESAAGCMSAEEDDDCVAIMDGLGLSFRGRPSYGQRFVRAETAN